MAMTTKRSSIFRRPVGGHVVAGTAVSPLQSPAQPNSGLSDAKVIMKSETKEITTCPVPLGSALSSLSETHDSKVLPDSNMSTTETVHSAPWTTLEAQERALQQSKNTLERNQSPDVVAGVPNTLQPLLSVSQSLKGNGPTAYFANTGFSKSDLTTEPDPSLKHQITATTASPDAVTNLGNTTEKQALPIQSPVALDTVFTLSSPQPPDLNAECTRKTELMSFATFCCQCSAGISHKSLKVIRIPSSRLIY